MSKCPWISPVLKDATSTVTQLVGTSAPVEKWASWSLMLPPTVCMRSVGHDSSCLELLEEKDFPPTQSSELCFMNYLWGPSLFHWFVPYVHIANASHIYDKLISERKLFRFYTSVISSEPSHKMLHVNLTFNTKETLKWLSSYSWKQHGGLIAGPSNSSFFCSPTLGESDDTLAHVHGVKVVISQPRWKSAQSFHSEKKMHQSL